MYAIKTVVLNYFQPSTTKNRHGQEGNMNLVLISKASSRKLGRNNMPNKLVCVFIKTDQNARSEQHWEAI